jgi:hypothetical protein
VPTLDELAAEPARVHDLAPEAVVAMLGRATVVHIALTERLRVFVAGADVAPRESGAESASGAEWLPTQRVVEQFGLSARWLAAHRRLLIGRRIISRPSRKTVVYHARRLARFLEERSLPPGS